MHLHCVQPEQPVCIALSATALVSVMALVSVAALVSIIAVDARKTRVELNRGYMLLKGSGHIGGAVLCVPAKIIDSATAEISEDQDALLGLVVVPPTAVAIVQPPGAKREERIECGSLGGNDAIARVGAGGVLCGGTGFKLKGRKGIDIDVLPAVILGCAEGTGAVTAR